MHKQLRLFSLVTVIILAVSAFVSVSPSFALFSGNMIVDGNASNGLNRWITTIDNCGNTADGLKDWISVDNCWKTATSYGRVSAYDKCFFYPQGFKGKDGATTRIYQDIGLVNHEYWGKKLVFSAYVRAWDTKNADESVLLLEFFDDKRNLLDSAHQSSSRNPEWHKISVERIVPSNATRVRASLCAVYHDGSEADAYFDNVSLVYRPDNKQVNKPSSPPKKPSHNPTASQNLISNGSASNGLKGWKTVDNCWKTATSYDQVSAYDKHFFYPQGFKGKDGATTRIYQDINISSYAGRKMTFSAHVRTWDTKNTDESVLLLEFFDAKGKLIDSARQSSSCNPKWHQISVARTVPRNAARVRASLCAVYHYGSEVDAYFDNVKLVVY